MAVLSVIGCAPESSELPSDNSQNEIKPELAAELNNMIADAHQAYPDDYGIVVAIRSREHGTHITASGYKKAGGDELMTTDAVFGIGSVHKNFKWVLLHRLVQEGKIGLNTMVNEYITWPPLPNVRMKHLMQHSAGLPDIPDCPNLMNKAVNNLTYEFSYTEIIDSLLACSDTTSTGYIFKRGMLEDFEIGSDVSYSSFGPIIGLMIAEKVTGQSAQQLTRDLIFDRLGMPSAGFLGYSEDPRELTIGHWNPNEPYTYINNAATSMSFSSLNGGAIYCNAQDLLHYCHSQFTDDDFLEPATRDYMMSDHLVTDARLYGLGIFRDRYVLPDVEKWGHNGDGIRAHATFMQHHPEKGISVVVMSNKKDFTGSYYLGHKIANAVIERL